jgi:hypothetical protein
MRSLSLLALLSVAPVRAGGAPARAGPINPEELMNTNTGSKC